jgi:hypothetical protein
MGSSLASLIFLLLISLLLIAQAIVKVHGRERSALRRSPDELFSPMRVLLGLRRRSAEGLCEETMNALLRSNGGGILRDDATTGAISPHHGS